MTDATMQAIAELLRDDHGIDGSFEYPGFISVLIGDFTLNFGVCEEFWSADMDPYGVKPEWVTDVEAHYDRSGYLTSNLPVACDDAAEIARITVEMIDSLRPAYVEAIAYLTVCIKCSMEEFAATIQRVTGKVVDPESADLLATLTNAEVRRVYVELDRQVKAWEQKK